MMGLLWNILIKLAARQAVSFFAEQHVEWQPTPRQNGRTQILQAIIEVNF
jgi:hypothetical protein